MRKQLKRRGMMVGLAGLCLLAFSPVLSAQGYFEFGFHAGTWNVNLLRSLIEEGVSDSFESSILDVIQEDYPSLSVTDYEQDVSFDSNGGNFGLEVRWFPGGAYGSFSLGFSVEKTSMTLALPRADVRMALSDGSVFQGNTMGEFKLDPWSFHMSLRWEISPRSRVHPYITLGVGAATGTALEEARFSYEFTGSLTYFGFPREYYQEEDSMTLKELEEEMEDEEEEFLLPGFIPFIQLNLGLKAQIIDGLNLLVDAGVFNGILFRGGFSYRF